jgi:hypothetical protein
VALITKTKCVFCAVEPESLDINQVNWLHSRVMAQHLHSRIPRFSQGLGFKTSAKNGNPRIIIRSPQKRLMFLVINFLGRNTVIGAASFSLQFIEHHAIRLEDLLELSKNLDASIHSRARAMCFCSWGGQTNSGKLDVLTRVVYRTKKIGRKINLH